MILSLTIVRSIITTIMIMIMILMMMMIIIIIIIIIIIVRSPGGGRRRRAWSGTLAPVCTRSTDGIGTPDPNPRNLVNWCF